MSVESKTAMSKWNKFWRNLSESTNHFRLNLDRDSKWDSSLLVFIFQAENELEHRGISMDLSLLPRKVQNFIKFAKYRKKQEKNQCCACVMKSLIAGRIHFVSSRFAGVVVSFRFVSFPCVSFRFLPFRFVSYPFLSFEELRFLIREVGPRVRVTWFASQG